MCNRVEAITVLLSASRSAVSRLGRLRLSVPAPIRSLDVSTVRVLSAFVSALQAAERVRGVSSAELLPAQLAAAAIHPAA